MKKLVILIIATLSLSVFAAEVKKKPLVKPKAVPAITAVVDAPSERKEVLKPSKLQKQFVDTTGIVFGWYEADSNPEECDSGRLKIADFGDELDLSYAGSSMIVGIGKDKVEESYSDCKRTFRSKYAGSTIEEISEETCSKEKTVVTTTLTVEKEKISYTVSNVINNGPPEILKCSATLKKDGTNYNSRAPSQSKSKSEKRK